MFLFSFVANIKPMDEITYPSRYLAAAVKEFSRLPGIGEKTALRLVLHILRQESPRIHELATAVSALADNVQYCQRCFNISDSAICPICSDDSRRPDILCIVEGLRDVIAIEKTRQFDGLYHVLGGKISPMDGIGPADLTIEQLESRIAHGKINEVIFALSTTMEGDTTAYYIYKRLKPYTLKTSVIARGVSVGDELEYTDELTLGRSIRNRIDYQAE